MSGFVKKVADLSKKFVAQILLVIIVILFAVLSLSGSSRWTTS